MPWLLNIPGRLSFAFIVFHITAWPKMLKMLRKVNAQHTDSHRTICMVKISSKKLILLYLQKPNMMGTLWFSKLASLQLLARVFPSSKRTPIFTFGICGFLRASGIWSPTDLALQISLYRNSGTSIIVSIQLSILLLSIQTLWYIYLLFYGFSASD